MNLFDSLTHVPLSLDEINAFQEIATHPEIYGQYDADMAKESILRAYVPLIKKVSGYYPDNREDAAQACVESLLAAIQDNRLDARLKQYLHFAVSNVVSENGHMIISERMRRRYWEVIRHADGNRSEAYRRCVAGTTSLTPESFLALGRALEGSVSLENALAKDFDGITHLSSHSVYAQASKGDLMDRPSRGHDSEYASIDNILTARKLITTLTIEEEQVIRLVYGFTDERTNLLRERHGFEHGQILSDAEAGTCIGKGRVTTMRIRHRALTSMKQQLFASLGLTD